MEIFDTNNIELLSKKLKELDSQAESLKAQRNLLNTEAKKWAERRDVLNNKNREKRNELKTDRIKRDEVNETIKNLQKNRTEINTQLLIKRKEYTELIEKLNNFLPKTFESASAVERQIEKLDWRIQTNPLSPAEESEIIDQIRLLEKEKLFHKGATILREKLNELRDEIRVYGVQKYELNSRISELAEKSRAYHNRLINKIHEAEPSINESNNAHRKFLESEKAATDVHRNYLEIDAQIKKTEAKIKEIENATYNKRLNGAAQSMSEAAYKKLKDGKKLTLDEFKLLKQKGLI